MASRRTAKRRNRLRKGALQCIMCYMRYLTPQDHIALLPSSRVVTVANECGGSSTDRCPPALDIMSTCNFRGTTFLGAAGVLNAERVAERTVALTMAMDAVPLNPICTVMLSVRLLLRRTTAVLLSLETAALHDKVSFQWLPHRSAAPAAPLILVGTAFGCHVLATCNKN